MGLEIPGCNIWNVIDLLKFMSLGVTLCHNGWMVSNILDECRALVFEGQAIQQE